MAKVAYRKRERGGRKNRASRDVRLSADIASTMRGRGWSALTTGTMTEVAGSKAIYNDHAEVEETPVVPGSSDISAFGHRMTRRSATLQQHLKAFPQTVEVEPVVSRQMHKETGELVTVTNNRVVWRSDRTLLERAKGGGGNGSPNIGARLGKDAYGFMRESAIKQGLNERKFKRVEVEEKPDTIDTINPIPDLKL